MGRLDIGGANTTPGPLQFVQFQTGLPAPTPHSEGLVYWDNNENTIAIMTDVQDVVLQVGQEMYVKVRNNTGVLMRDGEPVFIAGVTDTFPNVELAQADAIATSNVIGVLTADIAPGAVGYATAFGTVRDIDTSAFAAGDTVWLSATVAGGLTATEPEPPNRSVEVGTVINSGVADGRLFVNLNTEDNPAQTVTFTLPLRGVVDSVINVTGEFRVVASNEVGDYATDFAVSNNHVYLLINAITGVGDITITGISLSESSSVPIVGDTEVITVDGTIGQYYQTSKKWWEVTNIDIPAGITVIDYDIGIVGYTDINNQNFELLAYRVDAFSQGVSPDFRFRLIKIQDDGSNKMSVVDVEDIGVDAGAAGDQIIDGIRVGGDDRSVNPAVASIWGDDTTLVFKQGDFSTYFAANENIFRSGTHDEGLIIRVEGSPSGGITNVDFCTIQLRYRAT
jgi:hypothetical protein